MHRLRLSVIVIALVCLAGCTANRRQESLDGTLRAYAATLRWGDFAHALQYVDPVYREAHPMTALRSARYKQVRIVGYDEGQGAVPVNQDTVRQIVKIGIVNRHTQSERTVIDQQTWKWDSKAGRWWLETGLPDITHAPEKH